MQPGTQKPAAVHAEPNLHTAAAPGSLAPADMQADTPILNAIEAEIARLSADLSQPLSGPAALSPSSAALTPHVAPTVLDGAAAPAPIGITPGAEPAAPPFSTSADALPEPDAGAAPPFDVHADKAAMAAPHWTDTSAAPPFDVRADRAAMAAPHWRRRLALGLAGLISLGAVAGALLWYNGQRKVDRSLEVLAKSASMPPPAVTASVPPAAVPGQPAAVPVQPAAASVQPAAGPVQPAAASVQPAAASVQPATASVQPAAAPAASDPVPPLVLLPPEQGGIVKRPNEAPGEANATLDPAKPASTESATARKPGAKAGKALAKTTGKKGAQGKGARAGAAKAGAKKTAAKPKRRCKRGELVRVCLGLPE